MTPSEAITAIMRLDSAADEASALASEWGKRALDLREGRRSIGARLDAGIDLIELGELAIELLSGEPSRAPSPSAQPATGRRQRSDAGKPRGHRKQPVEQTTAAIRDGVGLQELLSVLEEHGPCTVPILTIHLRKEIEHVRKILPAYLQDSEPRVAMWREQRNGDSAPVELWGTIQQYERATPTF